MDPMRYLREKAEARAFARQGKELPKGMMGMFNDNNDPKQPKIDDAAAARMDEWDRMSIRDRNSYVNAYGPKLNEPFFPGQDPLKTKQAVTAAWNRATRG